LLAEVFFLRRVGTSGIFRYDALSFPRGSLFSQSAIKRAPILAALVLSAAFALFFGGKQIGGFTEIIPQHPPLITFPTHMMDWQGKASSLPQDILQALEVSDYWIADYQRAQEDIPVNFYIAYYASQRVGTTTHSPSNCIPGGGWLIDTRDVRIVSLNNGSKLKLTRLVIRRGSTAELVYYWFDERGRDLAETPEAKWYLLWDALTMHRSDGALIRLVTPLPKGMDEAKSDERMVDFLNVAYPQIRAFIPGAVYTDTSLTF
jgi:EpsI family protein